MFKKGIIFNIISYCELFNYYEPTDRDKAIVRERIAERIKNMKRVTYFK
jgi:hypothetical protein